MAPRTLALLASLVALLAGAAPAHARDLQVGMASDALLLNGNPEEAAAAAARWKEVGVDTVRVQVQWSRVAPDARAYFPPEGFDPANADDPRYNWGDHDRALRIITEAGLKPMLMLDGPPPLWATTKPQIGNPRYNPSAWHFGQFAAAVAKRYGEVTEEYILWNEPNLPLWLQPQARCVKKRCTPVSPHIYRNMVRAAYPLIHAADGSSKVLIGALAPTGGQLKSRNANMRPLRFLRAMGCVDGLFQRLRTPECRSFQPALADGVAHHPHSTKHPPHEGYRRRDDVALASLTRLERVLDTLQRGGRLAGSTTPLGLWLDEYAYQTNPPDKVRGVTPGRQDRYLQQAAYLAWRHPRVQMLAQYLWFDEPVGGDKRYTGWQSGLLTPDGAEKPALAHFDDPIWLDFERSVVWGQIRPGEAHDVQLQIRRPGATPWRRVADLRTAADGTWFVPTRLERFSAYRAVWDDGRTTATLVAGPLSETGDVTQRREWSQGIEVERRIAATRGGAAVPTSFTGLSIEWRSVEDYIGSGGVVNPIFQRLTGTLERLGGGGAPTLRFGGDSTDHTWWNPDGEPKPPGVVTDITPAWLANVSSWVSAARTPLVLGLNMGLNDPARAAALAGATRAGLPPGSIRAFELGNEPDLYPTPRAYSVGRNRLARSQRRPEGYGYDDYRREVAEHVAAVRPAAPDVLLSAGGFASGSWDDLQDDIFTRERAVGLWSVHSYPLPTCDKDIRRRGGARYIPKILAPSAFTPIMDRARHLNAVAASHGAKVMFTEINSAICGGLRGVSDTFAAALWGTDVLFGLAAEGIRNVDFHTWTGSLYGPIEWGQTNGVRSAHVRPLFYAMLLFNRATPPGSRLLPVGPNPAGGKLKTWGTIDGAGTRRFVVVNKDRKNARKVFLRVPGSARRGTVERLLAPSLGSQNNATFAGQGWGGTTTDGRLKGKRRVERVVARDGTFRVFVPSGSAAYVEVRKGG